MLAELGPPLRVAQAYAAEMAVDEGVTTGRLTAVARALWQLATTTFLGFPAALALFVGYVCGASFVMEERRCLRPESAQVRSAHPSASIRRAFSRT